MYHNPLQGFYDKGINTRPQNQYIDADFNSLNQTAFKLAVPGIANMDEHQIAILVKNNIREITEDILSGSIPYINLFDDFKFINGFVRAIGSIPIDYKTRLACNTMTYDYFTSDKTVPELKQRYLHISRVVNQSEINKLIGLGIDENTACNLALCRYSSTNERTNIKRLNFVMYHKDPNMMTEQNIVWIYEKLFDQLSQLFYGIMFEVYTPQEEQDFGENFMEVYGTVSLAILDMLNNMTSENMKKVLIGYYQDWMFLGKPPVRFSLRTLSGDYSHITRVVENLDSTGRYLP